MTVNFFSQPYVTYDSIGHVQEVRWTGQYKIIMIGTLLLYCIIMVDYCYLKEILNDSKFL